MSKHLDGARLQAAVSGGTPPHTPANELSRNDFRDAFNWNPVDKRAFGEHLGAPLAPANEQSRLDTGALEAAASGDVTEKDFRDFVKQWFQQNGGRFGKEFSANVLLNPDSKESCLATVYNNYTKQIQELTTNPRSLIDLPKDSRGSLVTARSQQDLALYVPDTGILFVGEVKNASSYNGESAIHQCAGYLYFQLWWFRTVQGKYVTAVYGFAISGPKCVGVSDGRTKNIAVSLLILKVPQAGNIFGQKYDLHDHTITRSINSLTVFDELGSLMKLPDPFEMENIRSDFICPGCMLLPYAYLKDERSEEDRGWRVITTGTGSLVLRCKDVDIVMDLLEGHTELKEMNWKGKLRRDLGESVPLFLKCRTLASGREWKSAVESFLELREDIKTHLEVGSDDLVRKIAEKWLEMYPGNPIRTNGCTILVMKDMGTDLLERPALAYADFKSKMLNLIQRTLTFQNSFCIVHGDIHKGNVVFDEDADIGWRLQLIDWDEETMNFVAPRKTVTGNQKARYPKSLTNDPDLYTKNQFLCLFSELNEMYDPRDNSSFVEWKGLDYQSKQQLKEAVANEFVGLIQFLSQPLGNLVIANGRGTEFVFSRCCIFLSQENNENIMKGKC